MIMFIIVWSCSDETFQARLLGLAEAAEALETVEEGTEEVRVECLDVLEVTEKVVPSPLPSLRPQAAGSRL